MATLHPTSMKKVNNGKLAHHAATFQALANAANESGAATAACTLGFINDDETIEDGEFVPEITLRVRRFPFGD